MADVPAELRDTQKRPHWWASMPNPPDGPIDLARRTEPLPDRVDAVVVGGGIVGLNAARRFAELGASVVVLEAERLGWGASSRNGGIVHSGFKWGADTLVKRYGEDRARAMYLETEAGVDLVERLVREHAIDCDWERRGHVELAYAPSHANDQAAEAAAISRFGSTARAIGRDELRAVVGSDAYFGGLIVEASGGIHPGRYVAGLVRAAAAAGVELRENVRAIRIRKGRSAGDPAIVETTRGRIEAQHVVVGTNGYTDGFVPAIRRRIIPIGSYMIATAPLSEELAREISPSGRSFFDTKYFLYYWRLTADRRLVFGGRASFIPTSVDRTARILLRGLHDVFPQLRGVPIEYAWGGSLGFTFDRMPHVGRIGGVTYAAGCCGSGVAILTRLGTSIPDWLGGGPAPALSALRFPLVPAPYEGRPWFLPFVGEWYRMKDRLAARSRS